MINRSHLLGAAALAAMTLAGCSSPSDRSAAKTATQTPGGNAPSVAPRQFEATRKDPPIGAETRFAAGQLAEASGNFEQAANQFRQTLALDPKHEQAMFHLGVVYAQMKKYPEAIGVWKKYVKLTGESPKSYSNLGFCYELAGRPEEAEDAYRRGIKKDPANVACHVNYGLMLVRRGRVGEGKTQLGAVLKPAEVRYNVGSVYESAGRKEEAKAEYRQALKLDPQFADAAKRLEELESGPTRPPLGDRLSKTE